MKNRQPAKIDLRNVRPSFRITMLLLVMALAVATTRAQMVTGSDMTDFAAAFGVTAKDWTVQETSCSLGANAFWPGEEATFTFFVKPGQPYKGPVKVDVVQYGTKGSGWISSASIINRSPPIRFSNPSG